MDMIRVWLHVRKVPCLFTGSSLRSPVCSLNPPHYLTSYICVWD